MSTQPKSPARFVEYISFVPYPTEFPSELQICGKLCTSSCTLSIHWKRYHFSTHGPRNVWTWKNKKMSSPDDLNCNICNFKASSKQYLRSHKQDHLTKQECKICRKPCSERFMVTHMKMHSQIFGETTEKPLRETGLF